MIWLVTGVAFLTAVVWLTGYYVGRWRGFNLGYETGHTIGKWVGRDLYRPTWECWPLKACTDENLCSDQFP